MTGFGALSRASAQSQTVGSYFIDDFRESEVAASEPLFTS
jgi:hypothetical protein